MPSFDKSHLGALERTLAAHVESDAVGGITWLAAAVQDFTTGVYTAIAE